MIENLNSQREVNNFYILVVLTLKSLKYFDVLYLYCIVTTRLWCAKLCMYIHHLSFTSIPHQILLLVSINESILAIFWFSFIHHQCSTTICIPFTTP